MRRLLPLFTVIVLLLSAVLVPSLAQIRDVDKTPIVPTIPTANRDDGSKVFLERADQLMSTREVEYQVLVGNVLFRRAGMLMYCDSAHYYDKSGSFDAFGNVRMEQGDTLFVYADELNYDDMTKLAVLYANPGKKVRLINRDVTLITDIFNYDLGLDLGYYEVGGELADNQNTLTSLEGEYNPTTKEAVFKDNVKLTSRSEKDTLRIFTDYLYYNTATHVAEMNTVSEIINGDGTIYTTNGVYNTETTKAELYDRSMVVSKNGNSLTGDTLYYDRKLGFGEAFGNMELNDTTNKVIMQGDYGYYDENIDSAFVTGRARAIEYSQKDSLYLHGDTIRAFRIINFLKKMKEGNDSVPFGADTEYAGNDSIEVADTVRYVVAAPHVKFYRKDLQGLCDSMTFVSTDTMIYMNHRPIIWSENRQVFGDVIKVHLNDSTIDRANVIANTLMAEFIEDGYYNQLSGKEMIAKFLDGKLRHLDVNGNVLAVSFPEESDSTINKVTNIESSFLAADFKDNTIDKMKLWSETNASVTPLYLAKKSLYFLPMFKWYGDYRPTSPEDIFNFPEELLQLFAEARATSKQDSKSATPLPTTDNNTIDKTLQDEIPVMSSPGLPDSGESDEISQ